MKSFCLIFASLILAGVSHSLAQSLDYDDYVKLDEKLRNDKAFRDSLEEINNMTVGQHTMHNIDSECLRVFRGLLQGSDQSLAARSISPWRYVKNFDSRRAQEDRYVLDTACVCRGCFVKTGESFIYTETLVSRPIPFSRNIRTTDSNSIPVKVNMGCHCVYPTADPPTLISNDTELLSG